ncbi:PD-(D/E)XK nuclease family protein [Alteribacter lacisalsi]|nr:PD-(D/E)XK nuclease family protein [Alteribacter lacisalsi]
MSPEFLKEIASIVKENPFKHKVFIVPSKRDGRLTVQALAKEGIPVINVHNATAEDLIRQHPGWEQVRDGRKECSQEGGRQFIFSAMNSMKTSGKFLYFSQVKLSPALSEGVYRAILDIRLAGKSSEDLDETFFVKKDKGADLTALFKIYENYLKDNQLYDRADMYRYAVEQGLKGMEETHYIYFPHDAYHALPAAFLRQFVSSGMLHIPKWTQIENAEQNKQLLEDNRGAEHSFSLEEAIQERKQNIHLSVKFSPEEELMNILACLREKEIPFDQAIICYPDSGTYRSLLLQLREKEGIPITFSEGVPLSFMPSGRAVFAYLDWLKSGFHIKGLERLLNERLIRTPEGTEVFSGIKALKEAGGFRGYQVLWETLDLLEARGQEPAFTHWLKSLLTVSPFKTAFEKVTSEQCLKAVCTFLEEWSRPVSPEDESAKMHVVSMIEATAEQLTFSLRASEAVFQTEYWLTSMQVTSSMPEPGHIHAVPSRSALFFDFRHTFLVGMTSQNVPGSAKEDPVLLDEERIRIHPDMMTSREHAKRGVWKTACLVGSVRGITGYSYPLMDLAGNRKAAPAYSFIQLYRYINNQPEAAGEEVERKLTGDLSFISPETSRISGNGWWLDKLWRKSKITDASLSHPLFAHLLEGCKSERSRKSTQFTAYEGRVEGLTEEYDPLAGSTIIMSSSKLETLATCPYKYFLKDILKIEPEEEEEEDRYKWLDPAARGTLLHTVFERFYQELYDQGKTAELDGTEDWLKQIASEELARLRKVLPPPSEVIFDLESREIYDACYIFLKVEESFSAGRKPVHFELSFGFRDQDPVTIPLSENRKLQVRGKIDRVDLLEDGTYGTVDYKSGKPYGFDDELYFNGGRKLQHALYALAFEMMDEAGSKRVTQSHYLFPTEKGSGYQAARAYSDKKKEDLLQIIETLASFIKKGQFPFTENPEDCTFCEMREVCMRHRCAESVVQEKLSGEAGSRLIEEVRSYD